jgi:hypothetical protein
MLITQNYTFWASKETLDWDPDTITFRFGNKKGRPKPCITITITRVDSKWDLVIQDLAYYSTCSREKSLARGSGTVEMVQGALKVICALYPIRKICLTDKSYFPHPSGSVPLPEKSLLSGKDTWYQTYLRAKPKSSDTMAAIQRYYRLRELSTRYIGVDSDDSIAVYFAKKGRNVTEADVTNAINKLALQSITATTWKIPLKAVESYPPAQLLDLMSGGLPTGISRYLYRR